MWNYIVRILQETVNLYFLAVSKVQPTGLKSISHPVQRISSGAVLPNTLKHFRLVWAQRIGHIYTHTHRGYVTHTHTTHSYNTTTNRQLRKKDLSLCISHTIATTWRRPTEFAQCTFFRGCFVYSKLRWTHKEVWCEIVPNRSRWDVFDYVASIWFLDPMFELNSGWESYNTYKSRWVGTARYPKLGGRPPRCSGTNANCCCREGDDSISISGAFAETDDWRLVGGVAASSARPDTQSLWANNQC